MLRSVRARITALERTAEPLPLVFILESVAGWRDDGEPVAVERESITVPPRQPGDPFDWYGTIKLLEGNHANKP
jgi:hypothetical protein